MNFELNYKYYSDQNHSLSNRLSNKDWTRLRKLHINHVMYYVDEIDNKKYFQCSKCKQFKISVELHDVWVFDEFNKRRFSHLDNLCFTCHALEHLDRCFDINGKPILTIYRGRELQGLIKDFDLKCKLLYNKSFDELFNELLIRKKHLLKKLEDQNEIITNDYTLLNMLNQTTWSKYPAKLMPIK